MPKSNELLKRKLNKTCVGSIDGKAQNTGEKNQTLNYVERKDKPEMGINVCKSCISKGHAFRTYYEHSTLSDKKTTQFKTSKNLNKLFTQNGTWQTGT